MIEYLVIMKQNGTMLFSKAFQKLEIEEEIMLGFFAATANFSKEALQSMVEDVNLGNGRRVVLAAAKQEKLIAAAITLIEDDKDLVKSLLDQILTSFITKYGPRFGNVNTKATETEVEELLNKNSAKYGAKSIILALIVDGALGFGTYFLTMLSIDFVYALILSMSGVASGILAIGAPLAVATWVAILVYPIPLLITGFILGKRKTVIIFIFLYIFWTGVLFGLNPTPGSLTILLGNSPVIIIISIYFAFLGLNRANTRKLKR